MGMLAWRSLDVRQLAEKQQDETWALKSGRSGFELCPCLLWTLEPGGRHLISPHLNFSHLENGCNELPHRDGHLKESNVPGDRIGRA